MNESSVNSVIRERITIYVLVLWTLCYMCIGYLEMIFFSWSSIKTTFDFYSILRLIKSDTRIFILKKNKTEN